MPPAPEQILQQGSEQMRRTFSAPAPHRAHHSSHLQDPSDAECSFLVSRASLMLDVASADDMAWGQQPTWRIEEVQLSAQAVPLEVACHSGLWSAAADAPATTKSPFK